MVARVMEFHSCFITFARRLHDALQLKIILSLESLPGTTRPPRGGPGNDKSIPPNKRPGPTQRARFRVGLQHH